MTTVQTALIVIDDRGIARIAGTRIKVLHLAACKQSYGWGAEEMKRQFPHLTLAQIHAALTYYDENKHEIDARIVADRKLSEELSHQTGPQPYKRKMNKGA